MRREHGQLVTASRRSCDHARGNHYPLPSHPSRDRVGAGRSRAPVTRYPLPHMGLIADALGARLAALVAESEESDRRLAELITDTRRLIDATDAMLAEDRPE